MSPPEGLFDVHVHSGPDIQPRWGTDADVAAAYEAAGGRGVVLKNHYESTVGRALAAGTGRRLAVYGGIVLNAHTGGFNPAAAAAALLAGARVVWMPTQDAHTQHGTGLPALRTRCPALPAVGYAAPPVDPTTADALRTILRLVAEHDAVLATGHLGPSECAWLVDEAHTAGVRRVLVTHAGWVVPRLDTVLARRLASRGALLEITAHQLTGSHPMRAEDVARFARAVGLDHVVLSSDAGQQDAPPPPEALGRLVGALARTGLPEAALLRSASTLPRDLVTP
ncbi:DUF6282 family protein [Streptomyces sp. NPDC050560]|uniref:DUF6282 family protein n=1 Tax=Streptomyces sp. NPDC050560 TaxID=3365630 RepID=UPI003794E5E2